MERSLKREGLWMGSKAGYKDDGGGGGWLRIFCGDIAGLTPSELDIKSPCQVLPTLKDT